MVDKYKAAATVVDRTLQAIIAKAVAGANLLELCSEGDRLLEEGTSALYNKTKGIPKGPCSILAPPALPSSYPQRISSTAHFFARNPRDWPRTRREARHATAY